ncbi:MAG: hypothetical protein EBR30_09150 [Cytophagia bacterium]|nr:hypothetical protein [Cytophagia bacterium]
MALESRIKLTADNFSPQSDLIEVFSKKAGVVGVINPSQIAFPPSGGAGAIQFSDGSAFASDASNLFWDDTNNRLGIGTNAPNTTLEVKTANTGDVDFVNFTNGDGTNTARFKANGGFILGASSDFNLLPGTATLTRFGASFGFLSAPSAMVHIKGYGTTSGTTSLLVQNSSGTNLLQQKDNGELWIGTTASGLGKILVPHDSGYGQRVFMGIQAGVNLMATQSNDGLVFKANYNIFDGYIYNNSGYFLGASTGIATDTSAYFLSTQLQPVGGANSNLINLSGGGRLQGSATGNYIQVSGNMQVDSPVNILRGFYFNPTLSGAYSNANVFAVHSTYGGAYLNTATPNASAILQADSTTQGFLKPRMTTTQKNAIASPAAGLEVFDTTLGRPCFYSGSAWVTL